MVVLVDEHVAALSWLLVGPEGLAEVEFTATHPDLRRQGLARLAKLESMRRAAARGVRRIVTENGEANAPMLALNESLGFRRAALRLELRGALQ